ncbi:DUF4367 domain-containing protein [Tepidibacillus sp. HK-1]|uniref:DUF4367 domain-containing protein n=1 Tax=Tepidibacillus sp. HK-1 TaxID=1883407 RepID=UPI00085355CB|nr:DUF4367 domain-containing protein [Tepidibacillus sp. HK-1]GBF12255.1 hypothetical protein HK1_02316 [Tepidibacillus sp. HK-1]
MTDQKNVNFDQLMKEVILEEIEKCPPPRLSKEEAWEAIQKKLRENNNPWKRFFRSKKKSLYTSSLILILLLTAILIPQNGSAFSKVTEIFFKVKGPVTQLFTRVSSQTDQKGKNPPPDSDQFSVVEGSEIVSVQMSLEEAKKNTAFPIKIPKQVPSEFNLMNVTVLQQQNEKSDNIYLHFRSDTRSFSINEMTIGDGFGSGSIVDTDDTKVEKVLWYDREASLLTFKNGIVKLFWVDQNLYYSIEGQLTKEEIIQIAKSL